MAEAFVELGAEGVNYVTEKHWDKIHDTITGGRNSTKTTETRERVVRSSDEDPPPSQPPQSAVSGRSSVRRKQKNRLPSPEGSIEAWDRESHSARSRDQVRSPSLDRESQRSEQVIRAYEADRSDPPARPEAVLPQKDLRKLRRDSRMSYGNQGGYANSNLAPSQYDNRRQSQSQQPPRSRYDDDEGSDYDERTGQRYRSSGKGYDDRGYDDDYDREVVTTERYKGPARNYDQRRQSYGRDDYSQGPYNAGAVTQYNRRSTTEVDDYRSRRSQSRGRRDRDRDSRSRSRSGSRSRSRSREHDGIRGKLDGAFDTSMQGLGVGLAGAVVGGLAGREFGHKHKNRDIIIGALVGGLGANAAENKWRDYKDEKKRDLRRDEDRFEEKWDGRDYGRSRSAMR